MTCRWYVVLLYWMTLHWILERCTRSCSYVTTVKLGPTFNVWHLTFKKSIQIGGEHKCDKITDSATNLRPTACEWPISDAIIPLPVPGKSPPNVHSWVYGKGLRVWRRLIGNRKWKYGVGYRPFECCRPEICSAVGYFAIFMFPVFWMDLLNVGPNLTDVVKLCPAI